MLSTLGEHIVVNASAIVAVAALAFRDQLKLRLLLLVSISLSLYGLIPEIRPQWDTFFWTAVTWIINAWVIGQILLDRTHVGLTEEERALFTIFNSLTPGEFRTLLRAAQWHTAVEPTRLTTEGLLPDQLYYVFSGAIEIVKANRPGALSPQTFVGEIAFLRGTPASATVTVGPEARYLAWEVGSLEALLQRRHELRIAFTRLLSHDMASKVSRAATG